MFCLPEIGLDSISVVFVSSSESLGVFFLDKNIPVYITVPVHEQLKMKLRSYRAMSVTYEDEEVGCVLKSLEVSRKPAFVRINVNQSFGFDQIVVRAICTGTFLGWVNYYVKDKYNFLYMKSFSMSPRLTEPPPEKLVDFLILNRDTDANCLEQLRCSCREAYRKEGCPIKVCAPVSGMLNDDLESNATKVRVVEDSAGSIGHFTKDTPMKVYFGIEPLSTYLKRSMYEKVVVMCDFTTHFLEIVIHAFYVLKEVDIFILCEGFQEYKNRLVYMGEFLNKDFRSRMYKGCDPLPLSSYKKLHVISSVAEIKCKNYLLFAENNPQIDNTVLLGINSLSVPHSFFIPFEASLESIRNMFNSTILLNKEYKNAKEKSGCIIHDYALENNILVTEDPCVKNKKQCFGEAMEAGKNYFIDTCSERRVLEIRNSNLVYMYNSAMLVEGELEHTDKYQGNVHKLMITARQPKIKELFEKERYYFFNGFYIFPKSGYIVNFEARPCVERTGNSSQDR